MRPLRRKGVKYLVQVAGSTIFRLCCDFPNYVDNCTFMGGPAEEEASARSGGLTTGSNGHHCKVEEESFGGKGPFNRAPRFPLSGYLEDHS